MATPLQDLHNEIQFSYDQCMSEVSQYEDEYSENELSVSEVLRAHYLIADYFYKEGEGIGGHGPKSIHLLASAVSRQNAGYGGKQKWNTIYQKAATLLFGLIMNHPFHDANKRTAYLSTIHYFRKNGFIMQASEKELEDFTVTIAEHGLEKFSRYRDLKKKVDDPEVEFIAYWLKLKTRQEDKEVYIVTYRELNNIIKKYNARLENPHGNFIDVNHDVEVTKTEGSLFWKKEKKVIETRRACVIGFHGWTREVAKGPVKKLREALRVTTTDGVDSQSFFNGLDDMRVLIQVYEGALKRLAHR